MAEINERRVEQQLRNFERALHAYQYDEPLARFLSKFFKENKQMGSSDRRMTSRLCYNYFRLGNALSEQSKRDRLVAAEFLCETDSALVALYQPAWVEKLSQSIDEKVGFLSEHFNFRLNDVFPFDTHLSDSVNAEAFTQAQFIQPDLYIRVKEGKNNKVEEELTRHQIVFSACEKQGYRLANGTRLQDLRRIEGDYEVQDLSSQHTFNFIPVQSGEKWWDACAASGGKSLMLLDKYPDIDLLVSDIRLSILRNLDERFLKAKIQAPYRKKILDLSTDFSGQMQGELFDGILLDVPCSGSGTWGRTPEMIQQFHAQKIAEFAVRQKQMASRVVGYLKPGGTLVYLTCSVFKAENEAIIHFLQHEKGLQVEAMEIIKGYDKKADTMFAARLRKA